MIKTPSASYSILIRVELLIKPGTLGKATSAIIEGGGDIAPSILWGSERAPPSEIWVRWNKTNHMLGRCLCSHWPHCVSQHTMRQEAAILKRPQFKIQYKEDGNVLEMERN